MSDNDDFGDFEDFQQEEEQQQGGAPLSPDIRGLFHLIYPDAGLPLQQVALPEPSDDFMSSLAALQDLQEVKLPSSAPSNLQCQEITKLNYSNFLKKLEMGLDSYMEASPCNEVLKIKGQGKETPVYELEGKKGSRINEQLQHTVMEY